MASLGNPINSTTASSALINIAAGCGEHYKWAKTALAQLNENLGTSALQTAAGITDATEIGQINAILAMLAAEVAFWEGTQTSTTFNTTNYPMTLIAQLRGLAF